ncbi:hypothetical protein C4D60_Mb08t02960 [Musa balbisiana]|uniref:Survival protein SurE-like phosphatase/nucleotidase domain-containing protein n=1 Tax=Musa balbisiana TaxID=52838 RepID=A0A4S8K0X0_MUSBA|nr:hypothetical protein C4D60_Mb08t02960 [Musa balbisiana]
MDGMAIADPRPSLMVTNDDGIDAPGLRFLVDLLVAADRYRVLVCAPDSDQSGVGHGITWHRPLSAKRVEIMGATSFAVSGTPADCASLGISGKLFVATIPDLVISGINMEGKNNVHALRLAAGACLPLINAVLNELKTKTYPEGSFLNIIVPTDVANHRGFKIAKQRKFMIRFGWEQPKTSAPAVETYQTANMDVDSASSFGNNASSSLVEDELLFKRVIIKKNSVEAEEDTDHRAMEEGFITITPLGALSRTEMEAVPYFKGWLMRLADHSPCSSLLRRFLSFHIASDRRQKKKRYSSLAQ